MPVPDVSVVVLAYGDEPWLERCVRSALSSAGRVVEVVVVDNGAPAERVSELEALDGVTVVRPGANTGFAGGCHRGVALARGETLVLLNQDAVVRDDTLDLLAETLEDTRIGLACASVRLAEDADVLNTAGNPLHFTGLSWAGGHGERAGASTDLVDVAVAAGTCLALRRDTWTELGGLWEEYFAYHEDVDLSWRCWQSGRRCVNVPRAVALHRYEFSRNARKNYLMERNRLLFLLTTHERATLVRRAPALLAVEVAVLILAAGQGWAGSKLAGYGWLLQHRRVVRNRHRVVQAVRRVSDDDLASLLTGRLTPGNVDSTPAMRALDAVLRRFWDRQATVTARRVADAA